MRIFRQHIHEKIYVVSLIGIAVSIPISNFLMSFFTIILFFNWLIEGHFKEKFRYHSQNIITFCLAVPFLIHFLWFPETSDIVSWIDNLRIKIPLLIIPLVINTSKPLSLKQYQSLLTFYVLCVLVASVITFLLFQIQKGTNYREMIWFISHIRFALNICIAITILFLSIIQLYISKQSNKKLQIGIYSALICWFFFFLVILRSYTGFFLLFLLFWITLFYLLKSHSHLGKWKIVSLFLLPFFLFAGYETYIIADYYTPKGIFKEPYKTHTAQGNLYSHSYNGFIENGSFIDDYICEKEIRDTWQEKGYRSFDSLSENGNLIYPTLIRYLNSYGYTKDAEGIAKLSEIDIQKIEKGIASYLSSKKVNFRNLTYSILFEWDLYKEQGYYLHSSLFQRVHLWQIGMNLFKKAPVWGVGAGHMSSSFHDELMRENSLLKDSNMKPHSQYISFLISFGIIGCLLLLISFGIILRKTGVRTHPLFFYFLIILLGSMISEDTLGTQAGVTLFSFFLGILVKMKKFDQWHIPKLIQLK